MNWRSRLSGYSSRAFTFAKNQLRMLVTVVALITILVIIRDLFFVYVGAYNWKSGTGFSGKTLWEWMELLIIPAVLAVGAILFNRAERRNELQIAKDGRNSDREIAHARSQDAALQSYLDKMTELLLEKRLRTSENEPGVKAVARARTITTLMALDEKHKGSLLKFLYESDLITKSSTIINLQDADLHKIRLSYANLISVDLHGAQLDHADLGYADLSGADLSEADLGYANLTGVNLSEASLINADLSNASLRGVILTEADLRYASLISANLSHADLSRARLGYADLSDANLIDTDLRDADLRFARITDEQLAEAKSVDGAIMPDGAVHE